MSEVSSTDTNRSDSIDLSEKGKVAVVGFGAFVPGYEGLNGWLRGEPNAEFDAPKAAIVPARQRRRASVLSKALAESFAVALEMSGAAPSEVASVFGSAMGEATTMVGLLEQMWSEAAMISPMKFATSVHNAASGVLSIATENRGFTTSLGADFDTPAMSLMEGIALTVAEDNTVVICCGDESPPNELTLDGAGWSLVSAAIVLAPTAAAPRNAPRLSDLRIQPGTWVPKADADSDAQAESRGRNPNIGLLDLVSALAAGEDGTVSLDRGAGRGYAVRVETPKG
jgi:3-oxoacyl-(acyl-carrier-protein) synthase